MRTDDGSSLVEVLLATAILGLAVVSLISGLTTGIFSSALHREQASAGAYLRSAVESVRAQSFVHCAAPGTYSVAGVVPSGSGFLTPEITSVAHYRATLGALTQLPSCSAKSDDLQLVSMRVRAADGGTTESVTFPMRRP